VCNQYQKVVTRVCRCVWTSHIHMRNYDNRYCHRFKRTALTLTAWADSFTSRLTLQRKHNQWNNSWLRRMQQLVTVLLNEFGTFSCGEKIIELRTSRTLTAGPRRCLLRSKDAAVHGPCAVRLLRLVPGRDSQPCVFQGVQRRAVPLTLRRLWIRACYISNRNILLDRIALTVPACRSLCVGPLYCSIISTYTILRLQYTNGFGTTFNCILIKYIRTYTHTYIHTQTYKFRRNEGSFNLRVF
jgi:hypothetical protein